jgi:hypothetical protein
MAEDDMTGDIITSLPTVTGPARLPSPLEQLASIPEEEIWLQKQKSARTRRAYRLECSTSCARWRSQRRPSCVRLTTRL